VSRSGNPKQFLSFFSGETLLQSTARRCTTDRFSPPIISTGEEQRFFVARQLDEAGIEPAAILLEAVSRNTAPAIAIAAQWCLAAECDDPLLVMPSDHLIHDVPAFHAAVFAGLPHAEDGSLVVFGVPPTSPHTGFGYIKTAATETQAVRDVVSFTEKPDSERANEFLEEGGYLWNAGVFLFRPSAFLAELRRFAPEMAVVVGESMKCPDLDGKFVRPDQVSFDKAPAISIDRAVMEKTDRAKVVPMDAGWSDIGSWESLYRELPHDSAGNSISGNVFTTDVRDSIIRSDGDQAIGVIGLSGVACIVTSDAVLLTSLDRAQEVAMVVDNLRARGDSRADEPAKVFRPWGSYEVMDKGEKFQTKRIVVSPGSSLSLQRHRHRSEHWVVVNGTAEVTVGSDVKVLRSGESTYIPAGTAHRLKNPTDRPLHLVEVQCGDYLGEDDIVRLDDVYGRR